MLSLNRIIILAVCSFALVGLLTVSDGDEPPTATKAQHPPSFWMKKKLEYSEQILAGLANEDFDQIRQNAKAMNSLGQIEKWVRAGQPDYRIQLAIFRDANERLIAQADDKDIDGAALAYVQLTLGCVNCHKIVRDTKPAKANS
jgi:hypothetical protein